MKAIQKGKLTMGMAVRDYLLGNTAIISPLPNVSSNLTILQTTITQILGVAELQDYDKKGITDTKDDAKMTLRMLAADASRKLVAYATFTNNLVLLKEIKISKTALNRLDDADLKSKSQEIYNRAQSNIAALQVYGITAATQTAFLNAITAFVVAIPKPRLGIDERKQATQQLMVLFKSLDTVLKNIDVAIDIVQLSQVNFYNGYVSARMVILTGSNTLSLRGLITDAETGGPVKGVTATFTLDDGSATKLKAESGTTKAAKAMKKKSAEKGIFNIKSLPSGVYQVVLKKAGYIDEVLRVSINDGEMTKLNASISKI